MADSAISGANALSFAIQGRQFVGSSNRARAPSASIADDFAAQRKTATGRRLDVGAARTAVETAVVAGYGVISALRALSGAFQIAADEGVSGNLTGLTLAGTRISGVNITGQAGRLVKAIDSLVKSADTSGANLISSNALRFTIQTTEFGGSISVSPQPLDSSGLDIRNLSGLTREDALGAVSRIEAALVIAQSRVFNLETLRDSLIPGGGISREITRLISSSPTGFLPRGSLVNQTA